jgi:hypothetical protein
MMSVLARAPDGQSKVSYSVIEVLYRVPFLTPVPVDGDTRSVMSFDSHINLFARRWWGWRRS